MKHILKFFSALFLFLTFNLGYAQKITLSNQATVSVITCGTSQQLHSLFGHTGIRIKDRANGIDWVYNFGAFDFSAPNFYGKFLKGDLLYFIGKDDFNSFLYNYQLENRSVWEQPLLLNQAQKQAILNELVTTYGTEKALYTYKFIDKNCTTLAVDLIAKNTGISFNLDIPDSKNLSNREILNQYLKNDYIVGLGINLLFGFKTDQTFNHIFLPHQFLESIKITTQNGENINTETIPHFMAKQKLATNLIAILVITLFFIITGLLSVNKWFAFCLYCILGLVSVFLFGMQFYSYHSEVHYNYNLLLINPLFLLLAFYLLTNRAQGYKKILKIMLACMGIYTILVLINGYLFMIFPILIGIALTLIIQLKMQKKIQH